MVKEDPGAFRLDCGATWLNLLATKGRAFGARPVERIPDVRRFAEWLEACELAPVRAVDAGDLERARRLRETLRPIALATVDGEPPLQDDVQTLAGFLSAPDPVELAVDGRLVRAAPADGGAALDRIARQAVDQLTGPERAFLKVCPEDDCRGVFADPADRRRWCPSPACASRGRVRALRARRNAEGV
ncbi:CGNR zinc finger domain-containing protein [Actinomadura opuntiae]|uniref:CGNR zinc finger domain-containing protein n=1 Tax=Actinomadura sp. OS1-43 TaxID=604315 RepID=UPI00255B3159|nr:CGNR zinc finger domain-containing protein [Actinomadura sp. OS1-43]MDL4816798.1 CGNR zinc finger domain-containing protein [Actinomadura sp. OS1-43]